MASIQTHPCHHDNSTHEPASASGSLTDPNPVLVTCPSPTSAPHPTRNPHTTPANTCMEWHAGTIQGLVCAQASGRDPAEVIEAVEWFHNAAEAWYHTHPSSDMYKRPAIPPLARTQEGITAHHSTLSRCNSHQRETFKGFKLSFGYDNVDGRCLVCTRNVDINIRDYAEEFAVSSASVGVDAETEAEAARTNVDAAISDTPTVCMCERAKSVCTCVLITLHTLLRAHAASPCALRPLTPAPAPAVFATNTQGADTHTWWPVKYA